jgi:hypothetical protein
VLRDEWIVILGQNIQYLQIFKCPHIPQGHADVSNEPSPLNALDRGVMKEGTEAIV